jgi:NADP-dependent 3-hydroxy acid dehydrogenase YdfG
MSKVIAVFGAGSGLGVAVARRFGGEGFRVALVARRRDRLDALVEKLAAEGIEAAGFSADLSQPALVGALIGSIRERFGHIDVIEYGPISGEQSFTPAIEVDAATLEGLIPLLLLTPVEIARAVLPEWIQRGQGAFLLTQGASAVQAMPHLSGVGPVMAATRNWLYSLNGELAGTGVYAGTLSIAAIIVGSEIGSVAAEALADSQLPGEFPLADADDLAQVYWDMYTKRDRVEQLYPEGGPA